MSKNDSLFIYGKNTVEEALSIHPERIEKLYIEESLRPSAFFDINRSAEDHDVPLQRVPEEKIIQLVGRVNSQGIVAQISPVDYLNFFDWVETAELDHHTLVLFLDGIQDPHNFGAIIRSATAAGVNAIMVPQKNQAPLNAAVFKTSAGTVGKIPIIRSHSTAQGIKDSKMAGFKVIALDGSAKKSLWSESLKFDGPLILVIGAEGAGIHESTLKLADDLVHIPMENDVESLNASVSAALACYEWKRRISPE